MPDIFIDKDSPLDETPEMKPSAQKHEKEPEKEAFEKIEDTNALESSSKDELVTSLHLENHMKRQVTCTFLIF